MANINDVFPGPSETPEPYDARIDDYDDDYDDLVDAAARGCDCPKCDAYWA